MDQNDSQWSQGESACFLVTNSQEESQISQYSAGTVLGQLKALKDRDSSQDWELGTPPILAWRGTRNLGLGTLPNTMSSGGNGGEQAGGGGDEGEDHGSGEGQEEQAAGDGGSGHTGGGGGGSGEGQDAIQQREGNVDEDEEDEEHSDNSLPGLVRPRNVTSTVTPPRSIPPHLAHQQNAVGAARRRLQLASSSDESGREVSARESSNGRDTDVPQGDQPVIAETASDSDTGGISDALTATVSDTEGHGQVIQSRIRQKVSKVASPGFSSSTSSSPRSGARDLSSHSSTLSSFTSSSSDESHRTPRTVKKHPPRELRATGGAFRKQPINLHDTSTDTSTDRTSANTSVDTSTDKTTDKSSRSHDTSDEVSASQEDMFAQVNAGDDAGRIPLTPSKHIGTFQLSGQVLAAETLDEDSESYIPPSPEAYGSAPLIVPTSPTAVPAAEEEEGGEDEHVEEPGGQAGSPAEDSSIEEWKSKKPQSVAPRVTRKDSKESTASSGTERRSGSSTNSSLRPASHSFPQWQPSVHESFPDDSSRDSSRRSSEERKTPTGDKTSATRSQSLHSSDDVFVVGQVDAAADRATTSATRGRHTPTDLESWHLQLTATEQTQASGQNTRPHTAKQGSQQSPGEQQREVEREREVSTDEIRVVEEKTGEMHVKTGSGDDPMESQDLALHLSPSQSESQFTYGVMGILERLAKGAAHPDETEMTEQVLKTSEKNTQMTVLQADTCNTDKKPLKLQTSTTPTNQHGSSGSQGTGGFHLSIPKDGSLLRPRNLGTPPVLKQTGSSPVGSGVIASSSGYQDPKPQGSPIPARMREAVQVPGSLTIDMIDTQDDSPPDTGPRFVLERPTLASDVESQQERDASDLSVFQQARVSKVTRKRKNSPSKEADSEDPYTFKGSQGLYIEEIPVGLKPQSQHRKPRKGKAETSSVKSMAAMTAVPEHGAAAEVSLQGSSEGSEEIQPRKKKRVSPISYQDIEEGEKGPSMATTETTLSILQQATLEEESEESQEDEFTALRERPRHSPVQTGKTSKHKKSKEEHKRKKDSDSDKSSKKRHKGNKSQQESGGPEVTVLHGGQPGSQDRRKVTSSSDKEGTDAKVDPSPVVQPLTQQNVINSTKAMADVSGQQSSKGSVQGPLSMEETETADETVLLLRREATAVENVAQGISESQEGCQRDNVFISPQGTPRRRVARSRVLGSTVGSPPEDSGHAGRSGSRKREAQGTSKEGGGAAGQHASGGQPGPSGERGTGGQGGGGEEPPEQRKPSQDPTQATDAPPAKKKRICQTVIITKTTITITEEDVNGEIKRTSETKVEELSNRFADYEEDSLGTISPGRTRSTLSPGDLADISSSVTGSTPSSHNATKGSVPASLTTQPSSRATEQRQASSLAVVGSPVESARQTLEKQPSEAAPSGDKSATIPSSAKPATKATTVTMDSASLYSHPEQSGQSLLKRPSHKGSVDQSASLFTAPERQTLEKQTSTEKTSSTNTSGSAKQSASLFSELDRAISSDRSIPCAQTSDITQVFAKPTSIKRTRSGQGSTSMEQITSSNGASREKSLEEYSDIIPDTIPTEIAETSSRRRRKGKGIQKIGAKWLAGTTSDSTGSHDITKIAKPGEAPTGLEPESEEFDEPMREAIRGTQASPEIPPGGSIPSETMVITDPMATTGSPDQPGDSSPGDSEGPAALASPTGSVHTPSKETGTRVIAKWKDGVYYAGQIVCKVEGQPKYSVTFDDGNIDNVRESEMIFTELLPANQTVLAESSNGVYESGIIVDHYHGREGWGYVVELLESSVRSRYPRSRVALSAEQAASLISETATSATTQSTSLADVSLDNLVEHKRRHPGASKDSSTPGGSVSKTSTSRETPGGSTRKDRPSRQKPGDSTSKASSTSASSRQTPGGSTSKATSTSASSRQTPGGSTSTIGSASKRTPRAAATASTSKGSGAKKKQMPSTSKSAVKKSMHQVAPKATSTPTPKRFKSRLQPETPLAPSPLEAIESSPVQTRRSQRKAQTELFSEVKGPIPPAGSQLFQGLTFLLTHVDKTEEQRKQDKKLQREALELSTDESTSEDSDAEMVPFDKVHLQRQIEAGGGCILDQFNKAQVDAAQQCVLVSDSYQRTIKYFHCLASGIPCVSHVWIRDSCQTDQLQEFTSYILPAGFSIESSQLTEWNSRGSALRGMSVMVSCAPTNNSFVNCWTSILTTAGCHIVERLPPAGTEPDEHIELDLIVGDPEMPNTVVRRGRQLGVPIVSTEWVIQSLICGKCVDYAGHPKYKHTYKEKDK